MLSVSSFFVSILLARVVNAFAAWQPNCTLPIQNVNYISNPQVRGTMDIVWTCVALLSLCTWTIQHLMVPVQKEHTKVSAIRKLWEKASFNYTKMKWMGICIGFPEYILGKALTECLAAYDSRRQFKEWFTAQDTGRNLDGKSAHGTEERLEDVWTTAHGFFANMRGFALRFHVAAVPTSLEPSKPTALGRSRQNPRLVTRDGDPPYYEQEMKKAEATELEHCRKFCGVPCRNRPNVPSTQDSPIPASPLSNTWSQPAEPASDKGKQKTDLGALEQPEKAGLGSHIASEVPRLQTEQIPPQYSSPTEATASTLVDSPKLPLYDIMMGSEPSTYALSPVVPKPTPVQQNAPPGSHRRKEVTPESQQLGPHKIWKGSWTLSSIQLLYACQKGIIPGPPELSRADLEDRSKGDIFVKGAAILQLTWLVIQMISRATEGLAISLLEIMTLAYAVCSIVTYILLWHKPQDVMTPTYIDATNILTREQIIGLSARSPVSTLFVKEFWLHGVAIRGMADNIFPWTRGIPIQLRWKKDVFYLNPIFIGIGFGGTLFGTIHFLAWNFEFPTPIERILWRSSCCVLISLPLLSTLTYFMTLHNARRDSESDTKTNALLRPFVTMCVLLYTLARLYLMVEIFRSLAYAPLSTFQEINWPSAIPHVN